MRTQEQQTSRRGWFRLRAAVRATRTIGLLAGTIAVSSALAPVARAQGVFTWEGVPRGSSPAPQDGVAVPAPNQNPFNDNGWYATDERANNPNNAFNVGLNCNHTPGGSECGYNNRGRQVSLFSVNRSGTFTLNDGYFTEPPAGYTPDFIYVAAFADTTRSAPIFTKFFSLSPTTLSLETFNWAGINNVVFTPCLYLNSGDTSQSAANCLAPYYDQGAGEFLADDIRINQSAPSTAPEPSEMALLGTGLVGLIPVLRRRKILG